MPLVPAIVIGAVILTLLENTSYPPGGPRQGEEYLGGGRKVVTGGLHAAPLECSPISTSHENLTWVLACELYRKPKGVIQNPNTPFQTPPFARAVLKFKPRISLQISLVRGTEKRIRITTAEAKRLLNDDFDSSPHLLILPFMKMETQQGNDEQNVPTISIPHVPTLVGSTASFTTSQLKAGKNLASTFLQYYKRT